MTPTIGAGRVATLVGQFDRSPAYAGLADALRLLVADGRLPLDARLPSERELTAALRRLAHDGHPRVRRAGRGGYAVARRGAGTFTRCPAAAGPARTTARCSPGRGGDADAIDLNCAAPVPPPGLAQAYEEAVAELPAYLGGHGYYPAGLPSLQQAIAATYDARGLPTAPDQIMVTAGALSASPSCPGRSPAPASGCWSSRRATPTPPRRCATTAPGSSAARSTPTAGTSTRSEPACASTHRRSPT